MNGTLLPLAELEPLFTGAQLGNLAVILGGTAGVMVLIRLAGNWLAATHPEPAAKPGGAQGKETRNASGETDPLERIVVAAAAAVAIGQPHRIVAVSRPKAPHVESLMQIWSMEGRRQIYSSHKIR